MFGADGKPGTGDDFVAVPVGSDPAKDDKGDIIQPGTDGFTIVGFDYPGQVQFEDQTSDTRNFATGSIVVKYLVGTQSAGGGGAAWPG